MLLQVSLGGAFQGGKLQAREPVGMQPECYLSAGSLEVYLAPPEPTAPHVGEELLFSFVIAKRMG